MVVYYSPSFSLTSSQFKSNREIRELEEQLAAEKARADGLERELAHALDMGSQASVCAELAQTRADRLEKDLDERADADMANYALHAKLDAEKAARLKAELACSETRDALEKARKFVPALNAGIGNYKATHKVIDHALSSDCGTGWLSPEVAAEVLAAMGIFDRWMLLADDNGYCGSLTIEQVSRLKHALALLKGQSLPPASISPEVVAKVRGGANCSH